jgi:hypothetical protein
MKVPPCQNALTFGVRLPAFPLKIVKSVLIEKQKLAPFSFYRSGVRARGAQFRYADSFLKASPDARAQQESLDSDG